MEQLAVDMRKIEKAFPGTQALKGVDFSASYGSVHALIGPNGTGKSTLMKILAGVLAPDSGELIVDGAARRFHGICDAQNAGVAFIHQELSLLQYRKVYQNMFLGEELMLERFPFLTDETRMRRETEETLRELGFPVAADAPVYRLSVAQQQMVEIARALRKKRRILIMDEPTSSLSKPEIEHLFTIIRRLKAEGCCIIYISHRMEEIFEIADMVTVMRDGQVLQRGPTADFTLEDFVTLFADGRRGGFVRRCRKAGEELFRCEGLSGGRFRDCSLTLHRGEIVSITGMVGAGRSELVKAIFGLEKIDSGEMWLRGQPWQSGSPWESVRAGLGLLPEDRKAEGLVMGFNVEQNIVQAALPQLAQRGVLNHRLERAAAGTAARQAVYDFGLDRGPASLSGGNQQKVMVARWLCANCDILIFDEPTRGIDILAKGEIYRLMEDFAAEGKAILMVSSDQMEVVQISDRVYVMKDGLISGHLACEEITTGNIMRFAV